MTATPLHRLSLLSWEIHTDGTCLMVSPFWTKVTGKDTKQFLSVFHPEDQSRLLHVLQVHVGNNQPFTFDCRMRWNDGKYRRVLYQIEQQAEETPLTFVGYGFEIPQEQPPQNQHADNPELTDRILNNLIVGVVKVDTTGSIIFANPTAAQILSLETSQITGQLYQSSDWQHIDLDGKPYPVDQLPLSIALREQRPVQNIQHGIRYKGTVKWLSVNASPIYDPLTGKLRGAVASFNGITHTMQIQFRLKRNLLELDNFKKALDRSAIISITDRKGIIIDANDTFCQISGYTREELLGKDHNIINSGYHPKSYFQELWRTIARGKPWRGETRNQRKDGSYYWVDTVISPLYNEDGKIDRYLSVRNDITQRKAHEERLHDLALVAQETDNMVVITDKEEKIEWVNRAFTTVTGYTLEEVKGQKPGHILQGPETDMQTVQKIRAAFANLEGIETELINYRKDKQKYWTKINVQPVFNENGELIKYISVQSDITQRRFSEQQLLTQNNELKKANSELDNFVYRVSHDLRAPIASSMGLIELSLQIQDIEQIKDYLRLQRKSLQKLDNFIRDILNYSRNARLEIACDVIEWNKLLDEVLSGLIQPSNQHIHIRQIIEKEGVFYSDQVRLSIILNNLLSNALKFTRPYEANPWIEIQIKSNSDYSEITISDNGTGITEADQPKVFDMFYRATDTNYGTGLGLYIVRESVSRLKGEISLQSAHNQGSHFKVWIPGCQEVSVP